MRNTVAKKIRKEIYGDFSTRMRKYTVSSKGVCHADNRRKTYQQAKKDHTRKNLH